MSWLKVDDAMGGHRKTRRLLRKGRAGSGMAAFGLHALALLHCSEYLTDGYVEREFVDETLDDARVTGKARAQMVAALVEGGQWSIADNGWRIHDYLDHNPSRVDVEAAREKERRRKAKGRETQAAGREDSGDPGSDVPFDVRELSARTDPGTDVGVHAESSGPVPLPSRPVPELPPDPLPGEQPARPSFDGKPISDTRWELLQRVLAEFDRQAGTTYAERIIDGRGRLSDNARRVIGAITADSRLQSFAACQAVITVGLEPERRYWTGRPEPRNVFGPKVIDKLASETEPRHLRAVGEHVDPMALKRAERQIETGSVDSRSAEVLRAAGVEFDPALLTGGVA